MVDNLLKGMGVELFSILCLLNCHSSLLELLCKGDKITRSMCVLVLVGSTVANVR